MKGLIIENESWPDDSISAFLEDNPDLFESVNEQTYCLERKTEDLLRFVLEADAIIVASTWMYKDQLEDYLDAFLHPNFPVKKFYVRWFESTMNEWLKDPSYLHTKQIWDKVRALIDKGCEFISFREDDWGTDDPVPNKYTGYLSGFYGDTRRKMKPYKVFFDEETQLHYTEHPVYTLENAKEH